MSILRPELVARPLSEWTEEIGDVLWWRFPIEEPPWVGSPLSSGLTVEMRHYVGEREIKTVSTDVGGWPGYHTHWTPIVMPLVQSDEPASNDRTEA